MCAVCWHVVLLEENFPYGSVGAIRGQVGKSVTMVLQINSVYYVPYFIAVGQRLQKLQ